MCFFFFRLYITKVIVRDLLNYRGENELSFETGRIPNNLFAIIGENNTGKTSLFKLIRTVTDLNYLEQNRASINICGSKFPRKGTIACEVLERNTEGRMHILGVQYTQDEKEKKTSVAFWVDECEEQLYVRSCHSDTTYKRTWTKGDANQRRVDILKAILCGNIAREEEQDTTTDCPWKRYEYYLPKCICEPDATTQIQNYLQRGDGKDVDERKKVIEVAENILQTAGFPYYQILQQEGSPDTTRQQEGSSDTIMVRNTQTGEQFSLSDMPGGHKYLLNIALNIALVMNTSKSGSSCCLLADEPTRQMHPILASQVSWLIRDCCQKYNLQVVIITHSPYAIKCLGLENVFRCRRLGDVLKVERLAFLSEGMKALEHGKMEEILFSEIVFLVEGESDRKLMDALIKTIISHTAEKGSLPKYFVRILHQARVNFSDMKSLLRNMLVVNVDGKAQTNVTKVLDKLEKPYFALRDGDAFVGNCWKAADFKNLDSEDKVSKFLNQLEIKRDYFEHCGQDEVSQETLEGMCNMGNPCTLELERSEHEHDQTRRILTGRFKGFEKALNHRDSPYLKLLQKTAECRHVIYVSKMRAAESVDEKLELLAEYLGEDKAKGESVIKQTQELFRKYLKICQKVTRCYVWKHISGVENTYDLESFTQHVCGKRIGKHSNTTAEQWKEIASRIYENKMDSGNDYEDFVDFLATQVHPYFKLKTGLSVARDSDIGWKDWKPVLHLKYLPDNETLLRVTLDWTQFKATLSDVELSYTSDEGVN